MKKIQYMYIISFFIVGVPMGMLAVGILAAEEIPQFQHNRYYKNFQLPKDALNNFTNIFYSDVKNKINKLSPTVGGEVLHEFTLPPAFMEGKNDEEIDKHLYETLTAFSTQQGIEYFSNRRQTYRIFIEESYIISEKQDMSRKKDVVFANDEMPNAHETLYIYQKDSSFGDGVRSVNIKYDKNAHQFYVKILNEETIKYKGIIPIAKPNEFLLFLLVNREGNKVSVYGAIGIQTKTFNSLKKRVSFSMVYRMYALAKWFERESLN